MTRVGIIVAVAVAIAVQFSEAQPGCGTRKVIQCDSHTNCTRGRKAGACLFKDGKKQCIPCSCDKPSQCGLIAGKGLETSCTCPRGYMGAVCDCKKSQPLDDCAEYINSYRSKTQYIFQWPRRTWTPDQIVSRNTDCQKLCSDEPECVIAGFFIHNKVCQRWSSTELFPLRLGMMRNINRRNFGILYFRICRQSFP